MALIFNIRAEDIGRSTVAVGLVGDEASEFAAACENQRVALGISEVAGLWTAIGTGTLADHWRRRNVTYMVITDIAALPEPVRIVTQGDALTDSLEQPYGLDTLEEEDAKRIFGLLKTYGHTETPRLMAAEDAQTLDLAAVPSPDDLEIRLGQGFFHKVGMAYGSQCAFTGLEQRSLDGHRKEGIVIGVDGAAKDPDAAINQGLFVSRTIGFCYRNGLLAIGEDYDILRHPSLCAEVRMLLELVNRKARLFLPGNTIDWPDLEAARRHRLKFDY